MSTVASPLAVGGTRTSGAPVRTQNGKRRVYNLPVPRFVFWSEDDFMSINGDLMIAADFEAFEWLFFYMAMTFVDVGVLE